MSIFTSSELEIYMCFINKHFVFFAAWIFDDWQAISITLATPIAPH
jgi:hypothetical protein